MKEFLKPTRGKIIFTTLVLILFVFFLAFGTYNGPFRIFNNCVQLLYPNNCSPINIPYLILDIIILYLISCILVSLSKRKNN